MFMWRYTAGFGLPICVLHREEVLHQLTPWQELTVMIAAGAIDLGAAFRRATTGQKRTLVLVRFRPKVDGGDIRKPPQMVGKPS
jgi:hypothetical protein